MKRLTILFLILGQWLMAATIEEITIGSLHVPIIFEQDTRLPIASMQVVFRGSGHVSEGNVSGLARFSAQLLGEGSKKLGSSAFAEALENRAIGLSVHSGSETMVAELSSLKSEFTEGVRMLCELLKDPNYTQGALEKVRTTTIGALKRKENDFDSVADNLLRSLQFEGTPLQYPQEGHIASIEQITLAQIEAFLRQHLVRERVMFVIGGDMSIEEAKAQALKVLQILPEGETAGTYRFEPSSKVRSEVFKRPSEQAYIYFGAPYHLGVDHPDHYKARVATYILGAGGFGSRLMEEIRVKRGLAYSAYARVSINRSHSVFKGYLQTKNESLEEAKATVKAVIAEFVAKGVSAEELEGAKKFLLGSEPLRVETLSQRLSRTFMAYYKGLPLDADTKELERIAALSLDDLNAYIKAHDEILNLSFAIVTQ